MITGTRVIANIFHTRSWNASTCIWAIHNVCTRAVRNSILRDVLQLETKKKFALTSLVIEMTINWCGTVRTHAVRSAEIPRAIVVVVTLGWNWECSIPSALSRCGTVASNHVVGAELMEHHHTQLVLPQPRHIRDVRTDHRQTLFCTRPQRDVRTQFVSTAPRIDRSCCPVALRQPSTLFHRGSLPSRCTPLLLNKSAVVPPWWSATLGGQSC